MMSVRTKYVYIFLLLLTALVWLAVLVYPGDFLHLITCDVGQGDASLIYYKTMQILIDGGPDSKVVECLDAYIPFWDRTIEGVVLTHPQKDHYGGLIDVFKRYKVSYLFTSGLDSSAPDFRVLESFVGGSATRVVDAATGMGIRYNLIYLDILHPSSSYISEHRRVTNPAKDKVLGAFTSENDPNEFSVVAILRYVDFNALFTGDIQPPTINLLTQELTNRHIERIKYIKIPHHGSKNGITEELINKVKPDLAVISVGAGNQYGHPNKEVLELLFKYGVSVFRTDEAGNIDVETDGNIIRVKK